MTSPSPTVCRLCGRSVGGAKVYADCGKWQGVAHQDCLEVWKEFSRGRMTVAEVGRTVAPETWQRILQRSLDGFKVLKESAAG